MFNDKVWEIIHNRYSVGLDNRWHDGMSGGDWWIQGALGDPDADDETYVAGGPVGSWFQPFLARLHHAYAGNHDFFDNDDDEEWYNEWILPFDHPLGNPTVNESSNAWTDRPEEYFNNLRYYVENEAPIALFNQTNLRVMWDWTPPSKRKHHDAINKMVI